MFRLLRTLGGADVDVERSAPITTRGIAMESDTGHILTVSHPDGQWRIVEYEVRVVRGLRSAASRLRPSVDEERNSTIAGDGAISAAHSRVDARVIHVDARVIHTDEERGIAQVTGQVLGLTHTKETSP